MNLIHAIVLAMIQGVTELFPISSLGHSILISHILGWDGDLKAASFVPFLVALHLGTATALLLYFRHDWLCFLKVNETHQLFQKKNTTVLTYIILATIPAGLLGLLLEKKLSHLFEKPTWAGVFLILNGGLLFLGEWLKRRAKNRTLAQLSEKDAIGVGTLQALALLPGFSRSGSTLVGGLALGFSHEAAAHFSFLLATPLIFAAGVLEIPKLLHVHLQSMVVPSIVGGIVAGCFAYLSTAVLMRYMKSHEVAALIPFGVYCIIVGIVGLIVH